MTLALAIAIPLLAVYGLFLVWYGGRGQPLSPAEIDQFMKELGAHTTDEAVLQELQTLIAGDDGKEFVMQNLVRYRPKALYRVTTMATIPGQRTGAMARPSSAPCYEMAA